VHGQRSTTDGRSPSSARTSTPRGPSSRTRHACATKSCVSTASTRARSLDLPDDRAVFLLASTGHKRKGLDRLVEFFARTELPATLVVAGRAMQGTAKNVRHLGYRSDIENVYRAVDFTVMASLYEPFGLVGVESVLSGTPVLLAEGAGCAEVIHEPAQLPFSLARPGSLDDAVALAVSRWQGGAHRLATPLHLLGYDPRVSVHVEALLAMAQALVAARRSAGR
jgi:glycosyltransferase involved in cell wall biosynthesis